MKKYGRLTFAKLRKRNLGQGYFCVMSVMFGFVAMGKSLILIREESGDTEIIRNKEIFISRLPFSG